MEHIRAMIDRFLGGHKPAFEELLEHFKPKIWAYVRQKVPMPDAEDVFQELCITVLTSIPNLQDKDRFLPWLFSITRFKITDYYRARKDHGSIDDIFADLTAEEGQEKELFALELRQCIIELEDSYREVAVLHYIAGFRVREIVAVLGLKSNTVKSRIQRAKLMITKRLGRSANEKAITYSGN